LRVTRRGAVKARTQTINQLKALLVTAPAEVREPLAGLKTLVLVAACAGLRPSGRLSDPAQAVKRALRRLARRYQFLSTEIRLADAELRDLVTSAAPDMLTRLGVGIEVTGQLLTTVGDNPQRLRSEAAFAHLCGVAPIPASTGKTHRHRLNRGGNRAANNALYTVVLARLRLDERTRAYVARRTAEGLSRREIIRCLQRYVARELYQALVRLPASSSSWPPHRRADEDTHHPEPLDRDIGASWRSPTARRPGGQPSTSPAAALVQPLLSGRRVVAVGEVDGMPRSGHPGDLPDRRGQALPFKLWRIAARDRGCACRAYVAVQPRSRSLAGVAVAVAVTVPAVVDASEPPPSAR